MKIETYSGKSTNHNAVSAFLEIWAARKIEVAEAPQQIGNLDIYEVLGR